MGRSDFAKQLSKLFDETHVFVRTSLSDLKPEFAFVIFLYFLNQVSSARERERTRWLLMK